MNARDFLICLFTVLVGTGVALATAAQGEAEFFAARLCFLGAALAAYGAFHLWETERERLDWQLITAGSLTLSLLVGCPFAMQWIDAREASAHRAPGGAIAAAAEKSPPDTTPKSVPPNTVYPHTSHGPRAARSAMDALPKPHPAWVARLKAFSAEGLEIERDLVVAKTDAEVAAAGDRMFQWGSTVDEWVCNHMGADAMARAMTIDIPKQASRKDAYLAISLKTRSNLNSMIENEVVWDPQGPPKLPPGGCPAT